MRPIAYSLQFRGRSTSPRSGRLHFSLSAPSTALVTTVGADGVHSVFEEVPGGEATFEGELALGEQSAFDDFGTIEFGRGNRLRFHSVGLGRLAASPDPHLRHGSVVREVEGGDGQFAGAEGVITSNFFVSDTGEVTDNQFGLIFVAPAAATHAPEARARAPLRRLGLRETGAEFRRSSGFMDLLAECALWTAPWTGFPPNQDPDYTEEFALCASVWADVPLYDDRGDAQSLPSSINTRPQPR